MGAYFPLVDVEEIEQTFRKVTPPSSPASSVIEVEGNEFDDVVPSERNSSTYSFIGFSTSAEQMRESLKGAVIGDLLEFQVGGCTRSFRVVVPANSTRTDYLEEQDDIQMPILHRILSVSMNVCAQRILVSNCYCGPPGTTVAKY